MPLTGCSSDEQIRTAQAIARSFLRNKQVALQEQRALRSPLIVTPLRALRDCFDLASMGSNDVFVDLGSGTGSALHMACSYGVHRAIGLECDPVLAQRARRDIASSQLNDRASVIECDFFGERAQEVLREATVIFGFHTPQLAGSKLLPLLQSITPPTTRIVSYAFDWSVDSDGESPSNPPEMVKPTVNWGSRNGFGSAAGSYSMKPALIYLWRGKSRLTTPVPRVLSTPIKQAAGDPCSELHLQHGDRKLSLVVRHDAFGSVHAGGHVWTASRLLCRWLFANPDEARGRHVIELGCGLALPSLVAARLGAETVCATDSLPQLVGVRLEANAARNGVSVVSPIRGQLLDFSVQHDVMAVTPGEWDLVLFADCVYSGQMGEKLPHALALLLGARGGASAVGAFPSHVTRPGMSAFWTQVDAAQLEWEALECGSAAATSPRVGDLGPMPVAAQLYRFRVKEDTVPLADWSVLDEMAPDTNSELEPLFSDRVWENRDGDDISRLLDVEQKDNDRLFAFPAASACGVASEQRAKCQP